MESESRVIDGATGAEVWAAPPPPRLRRVASRPPLPRTVNLVCFLVTVVTTLIAGTILTLGDFSTGTLRDVALTPSLWTLGLPYSVALILILGSHEMGHYIACRRYGIDATLPFFIPGIPPIGTFGALIRIRSPFMSRRELFDVGVAGPIAGFVVALPVMAYGLAHSSIVHHAPPEGDLAFPSCLLMDLAFRHFFPSLGPGDFITLHPIVVAAWVGLLATFLNLLPIGQLDGGHLLYALSRRAHRPISLAVIVGLIASGMLFGGMHLIVFGVLWAVIGPRHPPLPEDTEGLGPLRILIALAALLIFILCFIPRSPQIL